MTYGDILEQVQEEQGVVNYYICSPLLFNVSELTMRMPTDRGGGGGRYVIAAPSSIIRTFRQWLLNYKGAVIEEKTNAQILSSWREFLRSKVV